MADLSSHSVDISSDARMRDRLNKRKRKQYWLQGFGIAAIGFAGLMLFILVGSLVATGYKAMTTFDR